MKILTAPQLKQWDAFTIQEQNISFLELMERAGSACTEWLLQNISSEKSFKIFCGQGNNGGDGLVIARLLKQQNRKVEVYVI